MGFNARVEVLCSKEFKVCGAIGPCTSAPFLQFSGGLARRSFDNCGFNASIMQLIVQLVHLESLISPFSRIKSKKIRRSPRGCCGLAAAAGFAKVCS